MKACHIHLVVGAGEVVKAEQLCLGGVEIDGGEATGPPALHHQGPLLPHNPTPQALGTAPHLHHKKKIKIKMEKKCKLKLNAIHHTGKYFLILV